MADESRQYPRPHGLGDIRIFPPSLVRIKIDETDDHRDRLDAACL